MRPNGNQAHIQVFATVGLSYNHSKELAMSLAMFRKALPAGTKLSILPETTDRASRLRCAIEAALNQNPVAEYFMVVKEPALLVAPGAMEELEGILRNQTQADCVLPSDIRGYRAGCSANYLTLRGFRRFAAELRGAEMDFVPYDGRTPFLFMVKASALRKIDLPPDPLDIPRVLSARSLIALNAYIHPFFDYYKERREDLIPLIPPEVHSVLDIGCARGRFGAAIRSQRSCRVVGIEMNAIEAEKAREQIDKVVVGNALTATLGERFDCITCLDSLEHVPEPEVLLTKIREDFLGDRGYALLSIPNVGHWAIVEDLLSGHWDYGPAGILSVTHLRFFTLQTIQGMLKDTGFEVVQVDDVQWPVSERLQGVFQTLKKGGLEIDVSSLNTLSYHVLARKS